MMKLTLPKNRAVNPLYLLNLKYKRSYKVWILTVYMTEASGTPGLSRKEVKSFSASIQTGAEIIVADKMYNKTTVVFSGYTSMT